MTGAPYTGRCACGAVTLELASEPLAVRQCWCRQCQQIASGSATQNAVIPVSEVTIHGKLASSQWPAESGNMLIHHFCPACGTQIYAQSSARPAMMVVRLGALDEPHGLRPTAAIWTDEAPAWANIDPALKHFPRQPTPVK